MNLFDWTKCREWVEARRPIEVQAGLLEDWSATAATVYRDGRWLDPDEGYLESSWATPGFYARMPNGDVILVEAERHE